MLYVQVTRVDWPTLCCLSPKNHKRLKRLIDGQSAYSLALVEKFPATSSKNLLGKGREIISVSVQVLRSHF